MGERRDDPRERPLDLVAELLATPQGERERRLAKLSKAMIVRVAALMSLELEHCRTTARPVDVAAADDGEEW